MASLPNQLGQAAKKTSKQTAQSIAQQVKRESLETAHSFQKQIYPQSEVEVTPKTAEQPISLLDMIQGTSPQNVNQESIKQNEEALLNQWRQRIKEIESDMAQERQNDNVRARDWSDHIDEQMKPDESQQNEGVSMPQGKVKKMMGAAANKVKSKMPSLTKTGENRAGKGKQ